MIKYTQKMNKNQRFLEFIMSHIKTATQEKISVCGDFLLMLADSTLEKKKLHKAGFCGNRFCPMCAWRLAKKDALKISVLMQYLKTEYDKEFIFLTLTAPNVKGYQLSDEITKYNKAFSNLIKRKEVKALNQGYIRKLEITYNAERDDYHPHFHVLIAVNKSYFTSRDYLIRDRWLALWQEAMDDDTITQVHVERVGKKNGSSAVNEIAKYSAKDSDYLVSQKVFDVFYNALKGRQVLVYNGLLAIANKAYKRRELNYLKEVDTTEYVYMLLYQWGLGEYVEAERRELTEDEIKEFNHQLVSEEEIDS